MPELLQLAPQDTLVLITDSPAGFLSTPDPLYAALETGGWRQDQRLQLPTWPGRFDYLAI